MYVPPNHTRDSARPSMEPQTPQTTLTTLTLQPSAAFSLEATAFTKTDSQSHCCLINTIKAVQYATVGKQPSLNTNIEVSQKTQ